MTSTEEKVEKKKLLHTTGGNVNWYIYFGEQVDNNKI